MTYALGWKTENEVFLAADAAITTSGYTSLDVLKTSFGKDSITNDEEKIEERAVKLYLKHNVGITYAGNCIIATNIIKDFYDEIEKGTEPEDALNWALGMNNEQDNLSKIAIIIGYHDGDNPKLLTYNSQDDLKIRTDEHLAQVGSVPNEYYTKTEKALAQIIPTTYDNPKRLLTTMLATLQSHALFDNLMQHGVGGTFSGLHIGKDGGTWQPDIFYVVHRKFLVSTCFRSNCLVVNSPNLGQSRCFTNYLPPQTQEESLKQSVEAIEEAKKLHHEDVDFDYVVVFGDPEDQEEGKTVVLVEMQKQNRHALIWLEPEAKNGRTLTKVTIFPSLLAALKDATFFKYVRYARPINKEIPKDRIREYNIDYEK